MAVHLGQGIGFGSRLQGEQREGAVGLHGVFHAFELTWCRSVRRYPGKFLAYGLQGTRLGLRAVLEQACAYEEEPGVVGAED